MTFSLFTLIVSIILQTCWFRNRQLTFYIFHAVFLGFLYSSRSFKNNTGWIKALLMALDSLNLFLLFCSPAHATDAIKIFHEPRPSCEVISGYKVFHNICNRSHIYFSFRSSWCSKINIYKNSSLMRDKSIAINNKSIYPFGN